MREVDDLERLVARCVAEDGVAPVNDQALVEVRRGERDIVRLDAGMAVVARGEAPEVELAVDPAARGAGIGSRLAGQLVAQHPRLEAWAHGDLPAAAAIATRLGLERMRTLLQLRAPVPDDATRDPRVRPFADADADAWVALNARAFAGHPEQGSLTRSDLDARRAQPWHDDANLLLVDGPGGGLVGSTWIKPSGDVAELYAIGVDPSAQGSGLGSLLLQATFARMRELGFDTAHLYVEGDNEAALGLYRSRGFTDFRVDVRWRHRPFTRR